MENQDMPNVMPYSLFGLEPNEGKRIVCPHLRLQKVKNSVMPMPTTKKAMRKIVISFAQPFLREEYNSYERIVKTAATIE
jgi:hypothetical protein